MNKEGRKHSFDEALENATRQKIKRRLLQATENRSVFEFVKVSNYLEYLYRYVKGDYPSYSYNQFAVDMGFPRSNCLRLVILEKRILTHPNALKITEVLKINKNERKFFLGLAKYNACRFPKKREELFQNLLDIIYAECKDSEDKKKLSYFSQWYIPVIREMASLNGFVLDSAPIMESLNLKPTPAQIEAGIKVLQDFNLITVDEKGKVINTAKTIRTDEKINVFAHITYQQKMMEVAKQALTIVEESNRQFDAITLCLDKKRADIAKEKIQKLAEEIIELENQSDKDDVYQLNIQFFPHTLK